MIGGEHTRERFSERLQNCQNQPKNRGYLPGTKLLTGGYGASTLQGSWSEERVDAVYYDGKSVLPPDMAKMWTTEYRQMTGCVSGVVQPPVFDQATMVEIVDRKQRAYPGHQPYLDFQRDEIEAARCKTTMRESYREPSTAQRQAEAFVPPLLGRSDESQVRAITMRFRHQLLLARIGESAFPGNLLRLVRHALHRGDTAGKGTLTVEELQRALAEANISASPPECRALARAMDDLDDGTICIDRVVAGMRGEVRDRRYSVIEKVYELLKSLCPDGIVRLQRLIELVDVDVMTTVMDGSVTKEAARQAFAEQWDLDPGAYVSFQTFLTYFADASFEIPVDQQFEVFMRNIWHLSGGNGKSMNTSCRRVRIVHKNGCITVREVKNDLDIKDEDPEMMSRILANLVAQGIKDAAKIEILPREQ